MIHRGVAPYLDHAFLLVTLDLEQKARRSELLAPDYAQGQRLDVWLSSSVVLTDFLDALKAELEFTDDEEEVGGLLGKIGKLSPRVRGPGGRARRGRREAAARHTMRSCGRRVSKPHAVSGGWVEIEDDSFHADTRWFVSAGSDRIYARDTTALCGQPTGVVPLADKSEFAFVCRATTSRLASTSASSIADIVRPQAGREEAPEDCGGGRRRSG